MVVAAVARSITSLLADGDHGYDHVVATKDYHIDPGSHFAREPDYARSWPAHCVAGSPGAEFHPDLATEPIEAVFRKGAHAAAYSGFEGMDDDGIPLADWLRHGRRRRRERLPDPGHPGPDRRRRPGHHRRGDHVASRRRSRRHARLRRAK
jgi:nicotinamidase-related amidase